MLQVSVYTACFPPHASAPVRTSFVRLSAYFKHVLKSHDRDVRTGADACGGKHAVYTWGLPLGLSLGFAAGKQNDDSLP